VPSSRIRAIRSVGSGTSGEVFCGVDKTSREEVALKYSRPGLNETQKRQQRDEVALMFDLRRHGSHPNLVKPIKVFEFEGQIVLIMQLWKGGDLLDAVMEADTAVEESRAAEIFAQLLYAVKAMHEHPDSTYLHRDIKPENVFVESSARDAQVLLGDFGTCVRVLDGEDDLFTSTQYVGTQTYSAPEVLRPHPLTRRRIYSPASDMWACGVVLHVMLSGRFPFLRSSEAAEVDAISAGRYYRLPDGVSDGARALVRRLLSVDPARRPTAAAALEDGWLAQRGVGRAHRRADWHIPTVNVARGGLASTGAASAVPDAMARLARSVAAGGAGEPGLRAPSGGITSRRFREARRRFEEAAGPDGRLEPEAFAEVMARLELTGMPFDRVYSAFCKSDGGGLVCADFLEGLARLTEPSEARLSLVFEMYSADGTGAIDVGGLGRVLAACATDDPVLERVKRERLTAVFTTMDTAGSGRVGYHVFRAAVLQDPMLAKLLLQPNKHFTRFVQAAATAGEDPAPGPWDLLRRAGQYVTERVATTIRGGSASGPPADLWTLAGALLLLLLVVNGCVSLWNGGGLLDPVW